MKASLVCLSEPLAAVGVSIGVGVMVLPRCVGVEVLLRCVDVVVRRCCVGVAALCRRRDVAAGLVQRMGVVVLLHRVDVVALQRCIGGVIALRCYVRVGVCSVGDSHGVWVS
ncbi:hypothetical protein EDB85DRAFT_2015111 [Lactarius pseudohatsudake]|nr:hypothetical protein EDB85DRAFT_2015111 [Lactarius pseudohatsudake]